MFRANASRHLTTLKKAGILESYKSAQWTYYKINEEFKNENRELYDYLIKKVNSIPCYENDCYKYNKCKQQDLCAIEFNQANNSCVNKSGV